MKFPFSKLVRVQGLGVFGLFRVVGSRARDNARPGLRHRVQCPRESRIRNQKPAKSRCLSFHRFPESAVLLSSSNSKTLIPDTEVRRLRS